ncbi:MAG TPA: hypothetical protein VGA19_06860, partial [Rhodospirillales bacterium]
MPKSSDKSLSDLFAHRFGAAPAASGPTAAADLLQFLAGRRALRRYADRAVAPALVETRCA